MWRECNSSCGWLVAMRNNKNVRSHVVFIANFGGLDGDSTYDTIRRHSNNGTLSGVVASNNN